MVKGFKGLALALVLGLLVTVGSSFAATKDWTVMVFINGDNNLSEAGAEDINEMEKAGSTSRVNIIVQYDSQRSWYNPDAGSTKRYYIEKDSDSSTINSPVLADMGEVNMGDYNVLFEFVKWGMTNYPAEHYALVIWNHGSGWDKEVRLPHKGISYDDTDGDHITTPELGTAMAKIKAFRGKNLDIMGMDACLMQMLEVAYEVRDSVDIVVASEETEPWDGWPYDDILNSLINSPEMSPKEFAATIASKYLASYSGGSQGSQKVTQAAINVTAFPDFISSLNDFCRTAMDSSSAVKSAIKQQVESTQTFYVRTNRDLFHFLRLVASKVESSDLKAKAEAVLALENDVVIKNAASSGQYSNAYGLAVYLPTSYYDSEYDTLALAKNTLWDEFIHSYKDSTRAVQEISFEKSLIDRLIDKALAESKKRSSLSGTVPFETLAAIFNEERRTYSIIERVVLNDLGKNDKSSAEVLKTRMQQMTREERKLFDKFVINPIILKIKLYGNPEMERIIWLR